MKRWLMFLAVEVFVYVGGIILMRIGDGFTNLGNVFLLFAVIVPVVAWVSAKGEAITRIRMKLYGWIGKNFRKGYMACVLLLIVSWFVGAVSYTIYSISPHQLWAFLVIAIALFGVPLAAILQIYD